MALPWVRLDTQFPANPKVLLLVAARQKSALFVYVCSLAYAGGQGTDGFIPTAALGQIHGTTRDASVLVDANLWHPTMGGWQINGWAEYQPSTKEHEQRKESLRRSSAKANCVRHHGKECGCWAR